MTSYEGTTQRLDPVCPRCGGVMQAGFALGWPPGWGSEQSRPMAWVEGTPERSRWVGIKVTDKEAFQITAWRCSGCGYLEFYAISAL
jgi:ribosomal protein S27AE